MTLANNNVIYGYDGRVMKRRTAAGFTLVELLMVVAVVGVIATISVPGLLRARVAGNEASGIGSLRAIASGEIAFSSACGHGGYATSLSQLFNPAPDSHEGFISPDLAQDTSTKAGYILALTVGRQITVVLPQASTCNNSGDAIASYLATADPIIYGRTGMRHFAIDERGAIFQDTSDTALTVGTLAAAGTISTLR
jgi:prepilin-type N-terminal cleavage/methylation domain-containing protein